MEDEPKSGTGLFTQRGRVGRLRAAWGALLLVTSAALVTSGCLGEPPEQQATESRAITGGSADVTHSNVFLLVARRGDGVSLCTATLLAPNLLLTARHCVSPASHEAVQCGEAALGRPFPASIFVATNDAEPSKASRLFTAERVEVPDEGADTCGYDIALIVLRQNVSSAVASPAVPRIDREVAPGEAYTAVGYGVDVSGQSNGRMQLSGLSIACRPGGCDSNVVKPTEFMGQNGVCNGDSGGPAFDADGKVVGVVSRGGPECTTPIYGAITGWSDFIVRVATEAAEEGGYEPPFWVATGSSDHPALDGDAGGSPNAANAGGSASDDQQAGGAGGEAADCATRSSCGSQRADLRNSCGVVAAGAGDTGASWLVLAGSALLTLARRRRG